MNSRPSSQRSRFARWRLAQPTVNSRYFLRLSSFATKPMSSRLRSGSSTVFMAAKHQRTTCASPAESGGISLPAFFAR